MRIPSESVANASMPRSIPVSCPVAGNGCIGTSAQENAGVPAVRFPQSRDRLGCAFQWAMPAHADTSNLRQAEDTAVQRRAAMLAHLWIGETVVAVAPMKAWIPRRLSLTNAAEERLQRRGLPAAPHPATPGSGFRHTSASPL